MFQEELRLFESRKTELASAITILREQRRQHIQAREELNRELQKLAENTPLSQSKAGDNRAARRERRGLPLSCSVCGWL